MDPRQSAERLLADYGVKAVNEIDLQAIATDLGALVVERKITGCDARIVGLGDRAVISIKSGINEQRSRFSLAHELGHWCLHKGRSVDCATVGGYMRNRCNKNFERQADMFASALLMPSFLFKPCILEKRIDLHLIKRIARLFNVSIPAAALRVCELTEVPMMIVYRGTNRNYWHKSSRSVPSSLRPSFSNSTNNSVFIVKNTALQMTANLKKVSARSWFETPHAYGFCVAEQTIRCSFRDALTLIAFPEPKFLEYYRD